VATNQKSAVKAFTLVEILIIVAAIAVVGSAGYAVAVNVQENARETKLESDTAAVNSALQMYKANGGVINSTDTRDQVLSKLKSAATADSGAKSIGLKGSFVDTRLGVEPADAAGSKLRAVWDASSGRFVLARSGENGIKRFTLNDAAAANGPAATDTRDNKLKVAVEKKWVWDYEDHNVSSGTMAPPPGSAGRPDYTDPTAGTRSKLAPPVITETVVNENVLANFTKTGTLTNSNVPGTSQLYYYIEASGTLGSTHLYTNGTFTLNPNDTVWAWADTIDPDRWDRSENTSRDYHVDPTDLNLTISGTTQLTYAQAGGAMLSGPVAAVPNVTISLSATGGSYFNSSNITVTYTVEGVTTTAPAFSGNFPSISIPLGPPGSSIWNSPPVTVSAQATSSKPAYYTSASANPLSVTIAKTNLELTFSPATSSTIGTTDKITISPANTASFPANYEIRYTTNGSEPTTGSTLYVSGGFSVPSGSTDVTVRAKAFPTASSDIKWFESVEKTATYSMPASGGTASGALVGAATLNSTFNGDLVLAYPANGSMDSIAYNSGAWINGNLYVPGTPTVKRSNGTVWSPATNSLFSAYILNYTTFPTDGTLGIPSSDSTRVIDLGGNPQPSNYTITFNNSSKVQGKIYRQIERYTLTPYNTALFPAKPNSGNASLDKAPSGPLSVSPNSSITLNSLPVGQVVLNPSGTGASYGTLMANNNTAFILNGSTDPANPTVYNIESLTLNSGADIVVNGYVTVNIKGSLNVNNGSVIGNVSHPEYLQLNVWGGDVQGNSGSAIYGRINAPNNSVTFNAESTLNGSVSAKNLSLNSAGVVFSLSPTTN